MYYSEVEVEELQGTTIKEVRVKNHFLSGGQSFIFETHEGIGFSISRKYTTRFEIGWMNYDSNDFFRLGYRELYEDRPYETREFFVFNNFRIRRVRVSNRFPERWFSKKYWKPNLRDCTKVEIFGIFDFDRNPAVLADKNDECCVAIMPFIVNFSSTLSSEQKNRLCTQAFKLF